MYYYVFELTSDAKELERITTIREYVSSLGIAGEMATLRDPEQAGQLVGQAVAKRYSTIVAVGGLHTINAVAQAAVEHDIVFGIIPLLHHPDIADLIGTQDWKEAANNLKRRLWQPVSLGIINGSRYFLTQLSISHDTPVLAVTDAYELLLPEGLLNVALGTADEATSLILDNLGNRAPRRGLLSRLSSSKEAGTPVTHVQVPSVTLNSERMFPVTVAGNDVARLPIDITTCDRALKLIVARRHQ